MSRGGKTNLEILEARDLHKTYRSGSREIEVLRGVSLALGPRETVSVRGESGSGKSTLLNLLAGIETADQGTVSWQGEALQELPSKTLPQRRASFLGFVFQAYYLVPELNALENVMLAGRIGGLKLSDCRQRAEQLLEELGMGDRLHSLPLQLSGGERQRAAIARALINRPSLILADEPTGNLDQKTAERVMDQFLETVSRHQASLILVTHNPEFAARADQRFLLEAGLLSS